MVMASKSHHFYGIVSKQIIFNQVHSYHLTLASTVDDDILPERCLFQPLCGYINSVALLDLTDYFLRYTDISTQHFV